MVGGLKRRAADSEPVALTTRDAADAPLELGSSLGPDAGSLKGSRYWPGPGLSAIVDDRNIVDPGADGANRAMAVLNTLLDTIRRLTRGAVR